MFSKVRTQTKITVNLYPFSDVLHPLIISLTYNKWLKQEFTADCFFTLSDKFQPLILDSFSYRVRGYKITRTENLNMTSDQGHKNASF